MSVGVVQTNNLMGLQRMKAPAVVDFHPRKDAENKDEG